MNVASKTTVKWSYMNAVSKDYSEVVLHESSQQGL